MAGRALRDLSWSRPWPAWAVAALHALAPMAAILAILLLLELAASPWQAPPSASPQASRERAHDLLLLGAALVLLAGAAAMAAGWRKGLAGGAEALAALGAWLWVLLGFVAPQGLPAAFLVPAFLLPWALLVVELPQRQRVLLLLMQWMASAILWETATQEVVPSTLLLALGLVHLVLVWATLAGRWRVAGLAVGAALSLLVLVAAAAAFAQEPTPRRALWAGAGLALLAATLLAFRGRLLARVKVPVLLRAGPRSA